MFETQTRETSNDHHSNCQMGASQIWISIFTYPAAWVFSNELEKSLCNNNFLWLIAIFRPITNWNRFTDFAWPYSVIMAATSQTYSVNDNVWLVMAKSTSFAPLHMPTSYISLHRIRKVDHESFVTKPIFLSEVKVKLGQNVKLHMNFGGTNKKKKRRILFERVAWMQKIIQIIADITMYVYLRRVWMIVWVLSSIKKAIIMPRVRSISIIQAVHRPRRIKKERMKCREKEIKWEV